MGRPIYLAFKFDKILAFFSYIVCNGCLIFVKYCFTHLFIFSFNISFLHSGAQWLSGRVLDPRPKGRGFEPHRRHCVVVLEQDTFILA